MTNDVSFLIEPMVEPINPTTLQCAVLENGDDLLGLHEKLLNWLQHADYLHEARNLGKRLQRGCGMNMWLTSLNARRCVRVARVHDDSRNVGYCIWAPCGNGKSVLAHASPSTRK